MRFIFVFMCFVLFFGDVSARVSRSVLQILLSSLRQHTFSPLFVGYPSSKKHHLPPDTVHNPFAMSSTEMRLSFNSSFSHFSSPFFSNSQHPPPHPPILFFPHFSITEPATMSDDGWGAGEEVAHGVHNALGAATEQNVNGMGAGLAQETPASPVQSPPPQPAQPSVPEPELFEGAYEAAARGWLPLKKKIAGQTTYHIAIAAPDLKGNYDTHSVCGKCVRHLGSHDKDILWSDVTEHLQPVRPNTEILSRWVNGKLSFDRAANGEWKIKSFGANWKTRHFLYGPNGLSYSKTDLSKKEKNSKIFTRTTEIIRNPSAAEFRPIAGDLERAQLHYFGLRFQHNTYQEALLMRVTDTSDKNIIVTHLEKTLNQLKQDEKWSHDSKPLRNKVWSFFECFFLCHVLSFLSFLSFTDPPP